MVLLIRTFGFMLYKIIRKSFVMLPEIVLKKKYYKQKNVDIIR